MSTDSQRAASYGWPAPAGGRRATPVMSVTAGSAASRRSTAVPTFPLAPTTTTRMQHDYPARERAHRSGVVRHTSGAAGSPIRETTREMG